MPRGGARTGAGRPPGKATQKTREAAERAAQGGQTPLDFMLLMLGVLRKEAFAVDEKGATVVDHEKAKEAGHWAIAAAPYCHPKLQAIAPAPTPPPPEETGGSNLERARRVAYLLITGAREKAKKTALLK